MLGLEMKAVWFPFPTPSPRERKSERTAPTTWARGTCRGTSRRSRRSYYTPGQTATTPSSHDNRVAHAKLSVARASARVGLAVARDPKFHPKSFRVLPAFASDCIYRCVACPPRYTLAPEGAPCRSWPESGGTRREGNRRSPDSSNPTKENRSKQLGSYSKYAGASSALWHHCRRAPR